MLAIQFKIISDIEYEMVAQFDHAIVGIKQHDVLHIQLPLLRQHTILCFICWTSARLFDYVITTICLNCVKDNSTSSCMLI